MESVTPQTSKNGDTNSRVGNDAPKIAPRLLEILVCPLTHATLEYDRDRQELISRKAGLAFPIRDGIPIMLIDEARKIET